MELKGEGLLLAIVTVEPAASISSMIEHHAKTIILVTNYRNFYFLKFVINVSYIIVHNILLTSNVAVKKLCDVGKPQPKEAVLC